MSLTNAARLAFALPPALPPAHATCHRLVPCARAASASDLERPRADAARRKVDDAQERAVVDRRGHQAQVGERALDLGALEEAHAAIDAIRNRRVEQRVLEHPRLRVRAVEDGDLGQHDAVPRQPLGHIDDERGLVEIRRRRERPDRLALVVARPQVLAEARLVVLDERIGGVEDVAVRAVVLLELDELDRHVRPSRNRARSAACWRRSRRETHRSTDRRRRRRTPPCGGRRGASATCTAGCSCPGTRRPAGARSAAGNARAGRRAARAAHSCAAGARRNRPRPRAGTSRRRARSARPGAARDRRRPRPGSGAGPPPSRRR